MPAYFAYGSNLDRAGMTHRCPGAVIAGRGLLVDHRFFVMQAGYASVRQEVGAVVHGLLWDVPDGDMPALDAYEEVADGLYRQAVTVVVKDDGLSAQAVIYLGGDQRPGRATASYMGIVIAGAVAADLPREYISELCGWLPSANRASAPDRGSA